MRKLNWKEKDDVGKFLVGVLMVIVWSIIVYSSVLMQCTR